MNENRIGRMVVHAAVEVHRELGPGLLESVYETVLAYELRQQGMQVTQQIPISVRYRGIQFDQGFRADLMVEQKVMVELKVVEALNAAHKKQLLSYLRLSGCRLGYLLKFWSFTDEGGDRTRRERGGGGNVNPWRSWRAWREDAVAGGVPTAG